MGIDHPSIGRFLGELKQAQKLQDHSYEQCLAGHPAPKKRMKYEIADQNILARVQMYGETNLMEYLRGLAYNLSWISKWIRWMKKGEK
uniref:Uncharacterized protein n=1 Tax=Ditylenchus dipsaci TaxID=166011 RepID=A0A915DJ31_9BILA